MPARRENLTTPEFGRPGFGRLWPFVILLLMLGLVAVIYAEVLQALASAVWQNDQEAFRRIVQSHLTLALFALFFTHVFLAALALPGASLLMLLTGAVLGSVPGTLLCLTACTVGACLTMLGARHFLQPFARRKLGRHLENFEQRLAADGAYYLFTLRMLPVIPFAIVNLAAGVCRMRLWTFAWVSFIGMLAGTFVYVNAGSVLGRIESASDLYSPAVILSLLAVALLPWLMKRLPAWRKSR